MNSSQLAKLLVESRPATRGALLDGHQELQPVELAESLQQMCYVAWTDDPQKVSAIVDTLKLIAEHTGNAEIRAYVEWATAIKALISGNLALCVRWIDRSENSFKVTNKPLLAATTQTAKIYALGLLGRYDEAVACGINARETFVFHGDLYSAGKIEHNIGNLYWRRDLYREAEPYLRSAHERFVQVGDQRQLAMVENCQAFVKTLENRFDEAESIYRLALERASKSNLQVTEAEIETGLSNLYLFKGRYDLALEFTERARQKYEILDMPNQSALCELEIADIYLELNLLPEASEFYRKLETRFSELGMQAELARSRLNYARCLIRLNETKQASVKLDEAESLYQKEGNLIGTGSVQLARAQLLLETGDPTAARAQIGVALSAFKNGESPRLELFALWLRAEIWLALGRQKASEKEFNRVLSRAGGHSRQVEYLSHVSLGRLTGGEEHFTAAADLVENARATLASDELRTSFFADKIVPYNELVKINLSRRQYDEAFRWHERSRSRTLVDQLRQPSYSRHSNSKLEKIRQELNWYYGRIRSSKQNGGRDRAKIDDLRKLALEREKAYSEMLRRQQATETGKVGSTDELDLAGFRSRLDTTTVIEFASIDGQISAFILSKDNFSVVSDYVSESELKTELAQFLFQIKTGRLIEKLSKPNRTLALERLCSHSQRLFDALIRPLGDLSGTNRLVFAPAGILHYLPFHALHNGHCFLIEQHEVGYTPSVSVLDRCMNKAPAKRKRALLAGIPDPVAPLAADEIESIGRLFSDPVILIGPEATVENLRKYSTDCDLIHLACHGKFRPDNPGFSSLAMYQQDLTVNEVEALPLENRVIVLSACESGLNEIVRGEELVGLTRAFFAAGASSLVLSLWRVNDGSTLDLMERLYAGFCSGQGLAKALRTAQRQLIEEKRHPYLWAPFLVSGRC